MKARTILKRIGQRLKRVWRDDRNKVRKSRSDGMVRIARFADLEDVDNKKEELEAIVHDWCAQRDTAV